MKWERDATALAPLRPLEDGWDGAGALAPHRRAIERAEQFLRDNWAAGPMPQVVPNFDGSVEFEWELGPEAVLVSFLPSGVLHFCALSGDQVRSEFESDDLTAIATAVLSAY